MGERSARAPALAADEDVGQVAARSALVEPELSLAGVLVFVCEAMPIDVGDVTIDARLHEANGHHRVLLLVRPEELASHEIAPVQEGARPNAGARHLFVLPDEPLREKEGRDADSAVRSVCEIDGWRVHDDVVALEESPHSLEQALLSNRGASAAQGVTPKLQAA